MRTATHNTVIKGIVASTAAFALAITASATFATNASAATVSDENLSVTDVNCAVELEALSGVALDAVVVRGDIDVASGTVEPGVVTTVDLTDEFVDKPGGTIEFYVDYASLDRTLTGSIALVFVTCETVVPPPTSVVPGNGDANGLVKNPGNGNGGPPSVVPPAEDKPGVGRGRNNP